MVFVQYNKLYMLMAMIVKIWNYIKILKISNRIRFYGKLVLGENRIYCKRKTKSCNPVIIFEVICILKYMK